MTSGLEDALTATLGLATPNAMVNAVAQGVVETEETVVTLETDVDGCLEPDTTV